MRSVVKLDSRRPFISNIRSILPYRGRRITQMGYLCCCLGVACGWRTSENSVKPKFAEFTFHALGCIGTRTEGGGAGPVLSAPLLRQLWNPLVLAVLSSIFLVIYLEEPLLLL